MSLMKTLAKVAIGVAVAKGASAMMNNRAGGGGSAGLGGLLGGLQGGGAGGGGIQNMLGGIMGGAGGAGALAACSKGWAARKVAVCRTCWAVWPQAAVPRASWVRSAGGRSSALRTTAPALARS